MVSAFALKVFLSVSLALKPLYYEMKERILQSDRLHMDESPVDIFDSLKMSQGCMWVLVGGDGADPPYRLYDFHEDRKPYALTCACVGIREIVT